MDYTEKMQIWDKCKVWEKLLDRDWDKYSFFQELRKDYEAEIQGFDFDVIKQEIADNANNKDCWINAWEVEEWNENPIACCFIGSVFAIYPSGKYYMPWTTNQTAEDCIRDEIYRECLESEFEKHGMFLTSGEGDPCDILACMEIVN